MAVALGAVAVTVRSILQRDVDHRISQLLTQETGEFANFVPQGVDPDTGGRFSTADRLLRIYLQRQYADPDEELLGLTGHPATGPTPSASGAICLRTPPCGGTAPRSPASTPPRTPSAR
ncbi:hypothetical protein SCALM49S_05044 [Streptomyces californicus]